MRMTSLGVTPILVITFMFKAGSWNADYQNEIKEIKALSFDSQLQKQQHIFHVASDRGDLKNYLTGRKTDSILKILNNELIEKKDVRSLTEKNAVQIYQIKQKQEEILKKLDEIFKKK